MRSSVITFLLCLQSLSLYAEVNFSPWGKEASMAYSPKTKDAKPAESSAGFDEIIDFHHNVVTHADGPRSHFKPSSSAYMQEAIRKYGFFTGFSIGCDRLMRENNDPWVYQVTKTRDGDWLKLDPVP